MFSDFRVHFLFVLITVLLIKTGTNKFLTAILIDLYVIIIKKIKIYKIRIEQLQSMIKKKRGGGGDKKEHVYGGGLS